MAQALGLTNLQVQGALKGARKKMGSASGNPSGDLTGLLPSELLAVAKMGVSKTERIVRVLRSLGIK